MTGATLPTDTMSDLRKGTRSGKADKEKVSNAEPRTNPRGCGLLQLDCGKASGTSDGVGKKERFKISVTINLCIGKDVPVQRVERLTLPGSRNTAKKALASVTAALKTRMRRPAAPSPTNTANSSAGNTIERETAETPDQPAVLVDFTLVDTSDNCGPLDLATEFRDDMNPNTTNIAPPKMHVSPSDGCLLTEASRPAASSAGLVGRIRGLKAPFTRSSESGAAQADPFQSLRPLLNTTQTNFILL
ncbi:hypothetical protein Y032_0014g2337 [Ancylostoma ceylanicum]|uniref:Uncharacterized protein n=1 Tax=Ancylostoma ceylanicum TaxID=53326 RepID=A0A016VA37_9BILA|nr:hypothetical protein Y032_0014g2337 [Ancylostoma ceylanicum]